MKNSFPKDLLPKNKNFRRAGLLLILALLVFMARFPYDIFAKDIFTNIQKQAESIGVFVRAERASLKFPATLRTSNLSIAAPVPNAPPLSFFFEQAHFSFNPSSLVFLQTSLTNKLQGYNGSIQTHVTKSFFDSETVFAISAKQLSLEEHPLCAFYNLKGILDVEIKGRREERNAPSLGNVEAQLTLDEGSYTGAVKFPGPFAMIPKVSDVSLRADISLHQSIFSAKNVELLSSLGSATGRVFARFDQSNHIKSWRVNMDVKLTQEGEKSFGTLLSLQAGQGLRQNADPNSRQRNFRITLANSPRRGFTSSITPL